MTRFVCSLLALTAPVFAQFTSIEIRFRDIGCASCVDSMPARIQRMRGVEHVSVDPAKSQLTIRLAPSNRIRLEQVRDALEQDGTKTLSASVRVSGMIGKEGGGWILRPANLPSAYGIDLREAPPAVREAIKDGPFEIDGDTVELRPAEGPVRLRPVKIRALPAALAAP